jgi:hypothetical protein
VQCGSTAHLVTVAPRGPSYAYTSSSTPPVCTEVASTGRPCAVAAASTSCRLSTLVATPAATLSAAQCSSCGNFARTAALAPPALCRRVAFRSGALTSASEAKYIYGERARVGGGGLRVDRQ